MIGRGSALVSAMEDRRWLVGVAAKRCRAQQNRHLKARSWMKSPHVENRTPAQPSLDPTLQPPPLEDGYR